MNGEHKAGQASTQEVDPAEKARLDAEAKARQDPANSPRMQAMAAIAHKHEAAIEEQLAAEGLSSRAPVGEQPVVNDKRTELNAEELQAQQESKKQEPAEGKTPEPKAPAAKAPEAKAPAVDLTSLGSDPVPMESLDALMVKVKIDGQERVMSLHDLRRAAQLDGAAHARLEHANTLLRQAQEAVAKAGAKPPVGVEEKTGASDSPHASKDVTAAAESLVDALFVGDKAAAVDIVEKMLGAQPAPQIDTQTIARDVGHAVRQQLSQEEAEAQFRSDFKDVVSDPILAGVADKFFEEAVALDPQKSYAELLTEAGNSARAWLQTRTGQPATGPGNGNSRQEKLERKSRLDEPRGLQRKEVQQEPAIPTHSDVIAQMRAARGLS